MTLRLWLLAPFLSLYGCASMPSQPVPAQIPPPPVALMAKCPVPDPLPDMATANELATFAAGWIKNAACERARSISLLQAWPQ